MNHFNNIVNAIRWTPDYPIKGVNFSDLSSVFGHPSLAALAKIATDALHIEKGQVVLGVPTRGVIWSTVLANAAGVPAFFLQKTGVGTALPGTIPFTSASTVYSGDKETKFLISPNDLERLKEADIVWVADDVCESGKTLASIQDALAAHCKNVRLIPLLTFGPHRHMYSLLEYLEGVTYPGIRIFGGVPERLFNLRGGPTTTLMGPRVYGPPSMTPLILEYASYHGFHVGDINWSTFDGGMANVSFSVPDRDIVFIYDAYLGTTLQDGIVHALARNCLGHMSVIIPFLPTATMERVDKEGILATAQTSLFSLCASMPITAYGPVELIIYDIHQSGTRFYTTDSVRYKGVQVLGDLVPESSDIIAFPDGGAYSRFKHLFRGFTLLVFAKTRQDGKRKICLSEQIGPLEVSGRTICIVDDLVRTGGTILETAKILRQMGASKVLTAFVHCDFDPGKTIPFAKSPLLDGIFTTNSSPKKSAALWSVRGDEHVSVSGLFNGTSLSFPSKACILASSSETKLQAIGMNYLGIFVGAVPSGVSEQPIGSQEGKLGVQNRLSFIRRLYEYHDAIAIESSIDDNHDVAHVGIVENGKILIGQYQGPQVPLGIEIGPSTVGEQLQRLYNLPSKDAWIEYFGKISRKEQIGRAICLTKYT